MIPSHNPVEPESGRRQHAIIAVFEHGKRGSLPPFLFSLLTTAAAAEPPPLQTSLLLMFHELSLLLVPRRRRPPLRRRPLLHRNSNFHFHHLLLRRIPWRRCEWALTSGPVWIRSQPQSHSDRPPEYEECEGCVHTGESRGRDTGPSLGTWLLGKSWFLVSLSVFLSTLKSKPKPCCDMVRANVPIMRGNVVPRGVIYLPLKLFTFLFCFLLFVVCFVCFFSLFLGWGDDKFCGG